MCEHMVNILRTSKAALDETLLSIAAVDSIQRESPSAVLSDLINLRSKIEVALHSINDELENHAGVSDLSLSYADIKSYWEIPDYECCEQHMIDIAAQHSFGYKSCVPKNLQDAFTSYLTSAPGEETKKYAYKCLRILGIKVKKHGKRS